MHKADPEFCKQYDESRSIIRQLESAGNHIITPAKNDIVWNSIESFYVFSSVILHSSILIQLAYQFSRQPYRFILVAERKDGVLDILLKSEDDILDDKSIVISLKEAKAKVFEILNDLNLEKKTMKNLQVTTTLVMLIK